MEVDVKEYEELVAALAARPLTPAGEKRAMRALLEEGHSADKAYRLGWVKANNDQRRHPSVPLSTWDEQPGQITLASPAALRSDDRTAQELVGLRDALEEAATRVAAQQGSQGMSSEVCHALAEAAMEIASGHERSMYGALLRVGLQRNRTRIKVLREIAAMALA